MTETLQIIHFPFQALMLRWETIVQDHSTYDHKANEFLEWLDNGRKVLSELEIEESLEQSMIKLQVSQLLQTINTCS